MCVTARAGEGSPEGSSQRLERVRIHSATGKIATVSLFKDVRNTRTASPTVRLPSVAARRPDRSLLMCSRDCWRMPQVALVLASTLAYPFFGLGPSLRSRAAHMLPDLDA